MLLRRSITVCTLVALSTAPLSAQMKTGAAHDPDIKAGGGALPSGWSGRTDRADAKLEDAKFVTMGQGFHVTSGPAAIYWRAENATKGPFTATATFRQTKAPMHPEAYGLFFAGKGIEGADQSYAYFLVRGDGKVMVKHRAGKDVHTLMDWTDNAAVHTLLDWTDNAAVHKADSAGVATNTLTVDASKADSVRLFVNGAPAAAIAVAQLGNIDGAVGLRVNHNLDVHVSGFTVTPKK